MNAITKDQITIIPSIQSDIPSVEPTNSDPIQVEVSEPERGLEEKIALEREDVVQVVRPQSQYNKVQLL